eukprot:g11150.t1
MGPKKKKGDKKGKGGESAEDGAPLSDADKANMFQAALQSLQIQLAGRTDETSRALEQKREMLDQIQEMQRKVKNEQSGTLDITRDMTRQYKGMQEELLNRINQLEGTIQALQDELERSRLELEQAVKEKDSTIAAKDKEISQMKVKMEDMAQEFGDMLKETLDRMRERIEVNSTGFDADDSIPLQRRLEEVSLATLSEAPHKRDMVDRTSNPTVDLFGREEENTISYGLLRSAVEMGEAVTEAGAVSAAAAFFRQNLDACAWAEEPTPPPSGTTSAPPGAPPLLKFPLLSKGFSSTAVVGLRSGNGDDGEKNAATRGGGGSAAPPQLELVVSRGPGPTFSAHETRVASYAALLLSQALARVRNLCALSEAQSALEDSFRGMQEASDALAALVEERERRSWLQARQGAQLDNKRAREVAAVESARDRAHREAEQLRGQLDAAGESLTAVSEAAGHACRVVAAACDPGDAAEREGIGLSYEEAEAKVIAAIESAARDALRCSSARVADGAEQVDGLPPASAGSNGHFAGDEDCGGEFPCFTRDSSRGGDGETNAVEQLHVPIPYLDGVQGSLVLSVHGVPSPLRPFAGSGRTAANALAACLGIALLALRETREKRRTLRDIEAEQQAAATSAAAAEAEAQERGERAVAGMRALIAAAQLSKAQADAAAAAGRRAEGHTEALGHLLSGLDAGRGDHAAVARVVFSQASAVVPGCAGAALLTPRRDDEGGVSTSPSFSPDPRAWATATASRTERAVQGSEKSDRGLKRFGRQWARRVERAAVQAAASGKTVCVAGGIIAEVSRGRRTGFGDGDGEFGRRGRVVCFSPVPGNPSAERDRKEGATTGGTPFGPRASVCSDRMSTTELRRAGEAATGGSMQTPCLIAWMLCLGASEAGDEAPGAGNNEVTSGAPWGAVSPLTDENVAPIPPVAEPPPPPPSPAPPRLLPRVSAAMEAVVHAVDLALHSHTATAAGALTNRRPERLSVRPARRLSASDKRGRAAAADAAARSEELERSRRDEELRRLRDGTADLAERVRMLEDRAAGLRASEARSAAALARARADAGAVRGELQLATLELERARRRTPLAARPAGNSSPTRGGGTGGLSCGGPGSFWARSGGTVGAGDRFCGLASISSSNIRSCRSRAGEGGAGGSGVPATPAGVGSVGEKGEKAFERPLSTLASTVLPGPSPSSSPLDGAASSSSAALQHMASVHARLSSSLKSGGLSVRTATPTEGTGSDALGVV